MIGVQLELVFDVTDPENPVFVKSYSRVPGVGMVFQQASPFDDFEDVASNLLTDLNTVFPENDLSE